MTVSTTVNKLAYTGNGVTTLYGFPIPFIAASDLQVYVAGVLKTLTTDYTISGSAPYPAGANVTFVVAPANAAAILIVRTRPYTQTLDLVPNDPLPADTVEQLLGDHTVMLIQQVKEITDRSFTLLITDTSGASTTIPTPVANKLLAWNSTATALVNSDGTPGPSGPSYPYAAAAGVDTITATFSPVIALTEGVTVVLKLAGANTLTNPTLNANGLGAKTITKKGGGALLPGDLSANLSYTTLSYNLANTRWELQNPAFFQTPWVVAGGTVDAITATYAPVISTLFDGMVLAFRASGANTLTNPTFSPNGLTARTITKRGGTALSAGDIPANLAEIFVIYNAANTRWELFNSAAGGLTLLATTAASAAASVAFSNTVITNAYNKYQLHYDTLSTSAGTQLILTISTDNGSTYLSTGYASGGSNNTFAGVSSGFSGATSSFPINGGINTSATASQSSHGVIEFSVPSATKNFVCNFAATSNQGAGNGSFTVGGGVNSGTVAVNNIKVAPASGTVTANFHLYGVSGT